MWKQEKIKCIALETFYFKFVRSWNKSSQIYLKVLVILLISNHWTLHKKVGFTARCVCVLFCSCLWNQWTKCEKIWIYCTQCVILQCKLFLNAISKSTISFKWLHITYWQVCMQKQKHEEYVEGRKHFAVNTENVDSLHK